MSKTRTQDDVGKSSHYLSLAFEKFSSSLSRNMTAQSNDAVGLLTDTSDFLDIMENNGEMKNFLFRSKILTDIVF